MAPLPTLKKDPSPVSSEPDGSVIRTDQHNAIVDILSGDSSDKIPNSALADLPSSKISDFDSAVSANANVSANTSKLATIEANAKDDQTGAEIKTLYEGEANTNAFTDTEKTKLAGIADGAEVNPSVVPQPEAEAGSATTERTWTAERVKQAIDAQTINPAGVPGPNDLIQRNDTDDGYDYTKIESKHLSPDGNIIDGQTEDGSPDGANDYILVYDASAAGLKKALLNNLPFGGSGIVILRAVKQSDEALPDSTTQSNDTDLVVTVGAKTYEFEFMIWYNGDAAEDFRINVYGTATIDHVWFKEVKDESTNNALLTFSGGIFGHAVAGSQRNRLWVRGQITFSAGGTFGISKAKNATGPNGVTMYAGSFMKLEELL